MKISIIVPVYNVEEYVEECILSLCNQSLRDLEIIVINDGSQDNSISNVKKINDSRIKIINQKNAGLSEARNTGLSVATGEYIAFVDSDDYINNMFAYEEMYNIAKAENSDIVAGNCIWYYSKEKFIKMDRNMNMFSYSPMNSEDFFIASLSSNRIYAPVWMNIYKRDFIINNNLKFKAGIYHEDEEFTPRALLKSERISIYDNEFYTYRQREGSITNSKKSNKSVEDLFYICNELERLCDTISNTKLKKLFRRHLASSCIYSIYKNDVDYVDKDMKKFIKRNAVTLPLVIKSTLLSINKSFYFKIQKHIDSMSI